MTTTAKIAELPRTPAAHDAHDAWDALVQADRVHRRVYTDEDIFAREMNNVFAATWVYLAHESEIAQANDFKLAWIGLREVVVARGEEGAIHVFANRCSHRGATVCREHQGNASGFTCPYHGWRFDNRGQLFGVPGKNAYGPSFKSRGMNLARPAQVQSYKGFIFATLNPEAPPLMAHLGNAARYMDEWIDHNGGPENLRLAGAHRFRLACNWKLIWDNTADGYHVPFSHQSLLVMTNQRHGGGDMAYFADADRSRMSNNALDNGHTVIDQRPDMHRESAWRIQRPQPGREPYQDHVASAFGDRAQRVLDATAGAGMNLNIFPNLALIGNQVQVLQPLAVAATGVCFYATQRKDVDDAVNTMRLRTQEDFPVMGEMDDAANFEECQRGLASTPEDEWVDMSRHYETGKDLPAEDGIIRGPVTTDLSMRNYYAQWKRLMRAEPTLRMEKGNLS
ncbi:MAG: aromatic ring-hydroxylating dioxygenase subunit alpha [Burkholderiaceae bacterium]|jgi:phenylpropionate dioxygenase-like ring-hydroxylating dioxygenase large terminal subunit|nr:aromatic ring-hydroxylating dioxygenase subunit alpha [Burkholderiaceae bacterium]